ncbi:hypothetical protein [Saccharothrix deserti]|nr:hypothetical protein [Saccharothrix deserti]
MRGSCGSRRGGACPQGLVQVMLGAYVISVSEGAEDPPIVVVR